MNLTLVFRKTVLILPFLFLFQRNVEAQIDTEFWFAVPEVTVLHADRPIYLRISALDQPAEVRISQPANPSFLPIVRNLAAGTTQSIDMSSRLSMLENFQPNIIANKGLLIQSSNEISVYYEVLGTSTWGVVNCDIFTLKGKNALGKTFYTPFQNYWDNNPSVDSWSSFDILASEDSTYVTITPSEDIVGHPAGIPFTILLRLGQTYSARAVSHLASNHLGGSKVTATKQIAITIKDDSMLQGQSYDLAGDQLVPVDHIGTEYVITKGEEIPNIDRVFICAIENSTEIFINGNVTPSATLQEGETFMYQPTTLNTFIQGNKKFYVLHISGFADELGGAILPPLGCTGSRRASFTRPTDETFALNIVVKAGGENNFILNNSSTLIQGSAFTPVPGTSGNWLAAQIKLSLNQLNINTASVLTNSSSDFHLGIMNGSYTTGFRYGYFSDYAALELGPDKIICRGDSVLLNAGFGKTSYSWNTGSNSQSIWAKDSGTYSVTITKGSCMITDELKLKWHPPINYKLPNDTAICSNTNYIIKVDSLFKSYNWNTGSSNNFIVPKSTGSYWVEVENYNGCKKKDTINILIYQAPRPLIIYNQNLEKICWDSTITLSVNQGFASYKWHNGETTPGIITPHLPEYYVTVTDNNGCTDSTNLQIDCSPVIKVYNLITADGNGLNDVFYVKGLQPDKWILEIYNRWGDLVYFTSSYKNDYKGEQLSSDVYYYILKHVEGKKSIKGWFQILKE